MPEKQSRVRLQLAAELQTARTLAGLSQREMAERIGLSQSLVSRVEKGERLLSRPGVQQWLRVAKPRPDVRDRVAALTEAAHTETRTWADLLAADRHLQGQARERNASARLIQDFAPTVVPGLLQTADYARRVIPLADIAGTFDHAAALAGRIERQGILHEDPPDTRRFQFLITERLLQWEPGAGTLPAQLAHLATVADLPNVDLAILPEDYAGALPWHNFVIRYPADDSPVYVCAELISGEQMVNDPESVALYTGLWERLWSASAVGDDAVDLIRKAT